jgi:hypothetical protein
MEKSFKEVSMENIDKYIGIPYSFNESSFKAADCAGLVKLFYTEHNWQPNDYPLPTERDWYVRQPFAMERFLVKNFDRERDVNKLEFGDLVLTQINNETHLLIYLEYGDCLSTFPPKCVQWNGTELPDRSFIVHRDIWQKGYVSGFKRRKE